MNYFFRFSIVSFLAATALLGVSCGQTDAVPKGDNTTPSDRPLTLYGSEDKDAYAENVEIKVEDLYLHIGKLKEQRTKIAPSRLNAFDALLAELDQRMAEFVATFEAFKDSPLESFLRERAKVNEKLVLVEDLYFEIITDYKDELAPQASE